MRVQQTLAGGWRFHLGEAAEAFYRGYDDRAWTPVALPHDWAVTLPFGWDHASGTGYAEGVLTLECRHGGEIHTHSLSTPGPAVRLAAVADAAALPGDGASLAHVEVTCYALPTRSTHRGRAIVYLRSGREAGELTLHLKAEGLPPAAVTLEVRKAE